MRWGAERIRSASNSFVALHSHSVDMGHVVRPSRRVSEASAAKASGRKCQTGDVPLPCNPSPETELQLWGSQDVGSAGTPKKANKNTGKELNQYSLWAKMTTKSVNPSVRS